VYNISSKLTLKTTTTNEDEVKYNLFLTSFNQNIKEIKFNNAVSDMMVFVNYFYAKKEVNRDHFQAFIQTLSLFAPHVSEEI